MIDSAHSRDTSLPEFLAARARQASDGRLVVHAIVGVVTTLGVVLWRGPRWYLLLSLALCFVAFGIWGIVDRELGEMAGSGSRRTLTVLRVVRTGVACVGAVAAAMLMLSILGAALGRIQS